jgi:DegV family protein with EDD domain
MPEVAIITDTTANIPQELVDRYDIGVAPQVLNWEGETLLDEVDISAAEFYARLQKAQEMPTTAQATVAAFKELFEPRVARGVPVVAILISTELSGTVQSAIQARAMMQEGEIEIIDSRTVAMALGFQVLAAARAAEAGESFAEVVQVAKAARECTGVMFVVDTLEFLHRGGRIGGASRLLGTALSLKPLLEVRAGRVEPVEKIRTKARAHARLIDMIEERVDGRSKIRIASMHAAAEQDAQELLERAKERLNPEQSVLTVVGPVLGTHAGPGTVGMAYCTEL